MNSSLNGYLILDKPLGITSTQAVGAVKKQLRIILTKDEYKNFKIGHGGTLDPLASGVLPIALGEATKTVGYVLHGDKEYIFTVKFGTQTTTDDAEGSVLHQSAIIPTAAQITAALPSFIGTTQQTPPAFSALKIDGERAYDLARAGEVVSMQPRPITIHSLNLVSMPAPDQAQLKVSCGKGTYVRALARDLAIKLGTYGHVSHLQRTQSGPFTLAMAISLEKLAEMGNKAAMGDALCPLLTALDDIPALAVTAGEAAKLKQGQSLMHIMVRGQPAGTIMLVTCNTQPIALCEKTGELELQPRRVFNL